MYPHNAGSAKEANYCYHITGEVRHHDHIAFDKGSDIPENMASVKSARFTLVSGKLVKGDTMEEQWADYKARVHSKLFVYVTKDNVAYEMNMNEFEKFVFTFCKMERESSKNGGGLKIRCKSESKELIEWLATKVA
jgi:hypothetical protein